MAIDIGYGAVDGFNSSITGYTLVDHNNTANETGMLDVFQIYSPSNGTGLKMGTFSGSGAAWTVRDYEILGSFSAGLTTFTGKNCDVAAGDHLGVYWATGGIDYGSLNAGYDYRAASDGFANNYTDYTNTAGWLALYATGVSTQNPLNYLIHRGHAKMRTRAISGYGD